MHRDGKGVNSREHAKKFSKTSTLGDLIEVYGVGLTLFSLLSLR